MKERPILFSSAMIRAILDRRKSQTRRIIKCACNVVHTMGHPPTKLLGEWSLSTPPYRFGEGGGEEGEFEDTSKEPWNWTGRKSPVKGDWIEVWQTEVDDNASGPVRCPGEVGDHLIVKESAWMWCEKRPNGATKTGKPKWHYVPLQSAPVHYCADHPKKPAIDAVSPVTGNEWLWRKKLGRFLPKWASRITLEIESVRVERLQDISEEDARAEGIVDFGRQDGAPYPHFNLPDRSLTTEHTAVSVFVQLWQSINGPESWEQNPYVWVLNFKRAEGSK